MSQDRVDVRIVLRERTVYLHIEGSVISRISPGFAQKIKSAIAFGGADRAVVDLGACHFLCSASIGAIMGFLNNATQRGSHVVIVRPEKSDFNIIEILGLDQVYTTVGSLAEAEAFFGESESP